LKSAADNLALEIGLDVANTEFRDLEPAAVAQAKLCVMDYLSCALASTALPWCSQAIAFARASSGEEAPETGLGTARKGAGIIGTSWRTSPGDAAFANAVLGHALVRDDMHLGSVSHLGVVVIPPLLATVERRPASGRQFIAALVAGYQTGGEVGRAILDVEVAKIHRPTGITGPLAGAAAAARVLGLDGPTAGRAIAIAANTVAGYNEWAATGGSEMFFHPGFAARNAITAVDLAVAGAYASPSAIEGPAGLFAAFGKRRRVRSGQREILDVFFKPVPACNYAQSAAQAARELSARERIDVERVERVEIRVARAAALYPGCDSTGPFEHVLQAKMSIQYNVAAALIKGHFDEANFVPANQPALLRLAARCSLLIDKSFTRAYPGRQGAEVTVYGSAGERWSQRLSDVVAAGEAEVRDRFQLAATGALGLEQAERLAAEIDALEKLPTTRTLAALLQPARSAGIKRPARTGTRRGTGLRAR
jgi:2-methylcitrate dehydratase PrpD